MPAYFDASVLLASLLQEPGQARLIPLWDDEPTRVSSILLEAECLTVLRRAAASQPVTESAAFLTVRLQLLDDYLAGITLKNHDDEVSRSLRAEPRLKSCRTLDAIHLATALLFQAQFDDPITVCSLDQRLREAAVSLGFPVAP